MDKTKLIIKIIKEREYNVPYWVYDIIELEDLIALLSSVDQYLHDNDTMITNSTVYQFFTIISQTKSFKINISYIIDKVDMRLLPLLVWKQKDWLAFWKTISGWSTDSRHTDIIDLLNVTRLYNNYNCIIGLYQYAEYKLDNIPLITKISLSDEVLCDYIFYVLTDHLSKHDKKSEINKDYNPYFIEKAGVDIGHHIINQTKRFPYKINTEVANILKKETTMLSKNNSAILKLLSINRVNLSCLPQGYITDIKVLSNILNKNQPKGEPLLDYNVCNYVCDNDLTKNGLPNTIQLLFLEQGGDPLTMNHSGYCILYDTASHFQVIRSLSNEAFSKLFENDIEFRKVVYQEFHTYNHQELYKLLSTIFTDSGWNIVTTEYPELVQHIISSMGYHGLIQYYPDAMRYVTIPDGIRNSSLTEQTIKYIPIDTISGQLDKFIHTKYIPLNYNTSFGETIGLENILPYNELVKLIVSDEQVTYLCDILDQSVVEELLNIITVM